MQNMEVELPPNVKMVGEEGQFYTVLTIEDLPRVQVQVYYSSILY